MLARLQSLHRLGMMEKRRSSNAATMEKKGEEMNFIVTEECVGLGLRAGAIVFRDLQVKASGSSQRAEIAKEVAAVRARFANAQAVRRDPLVTSFQAILSQV